jgi:hypothetical protein
VKNTIIAGSNPADCNGVFTSLGHNIGGDASCAFAGTGDLNSTNPMLGMLGNRRSDPDPRDFLHQRGVR